MRADLCIAPKKEIMNKTENPSNYIAMKSNHLLFCRWWCRSRPVDDGMMEFYVPWWAKPLDFIHRMIFGRVKLQAIEIESNKVYSTTWDKYGNITDHHEVKEEEEN